MSQHHAVRIKNIYHMLSYAYAALRQGAYKQLAEEPFEHIHDLFAAILAHGLAGQIRRGLYREYQETRATLPTLRGKLDMPTTLLERCASRARLGCIFDDLTTNALVNRICKTAATMLLHHDSVNPANKKALRRILDCLPGVETLPVADIPWQRLRINRGNASYTAMLAICRLLFESRLLSTEEGTRHMAEFLDDQQMHRLYEKFLLAYFRAEHPLLSAASERIAWHTDGAPDTSLPLMITDVTLRKGDRTLIIDAKYYGRSMVQQYGVHKLHSANLYQIYAYVKNHDRNHSGTVAGMLLYAGTDEAVQPNTTYRLDGGNILYARTLDMSQDFIKIRQQLDAIAHMLDTPRENYGKCHG